MSDEQGFRKFSAERGGALRRQALLLAGDPVRGDALAERALADTLRRWERIAAGGPAAAEEHARRVIAAGALRRQATRLPGRRSNRTPAPPTPADRRPPAAGEPAAGEPLASAATVPAGAPADRRPPAPSGPAIGPAVGPAPDPDGRRPGGDGDHEAAWRALAALPPRRRAVLVLRYDEGLDDAAVGARLGLPPAEAAAAGEAGLAALRSLLRGRGRPEQLVPAALAAPARDRALPARTVPLADAAAERSGYDRRRRLGVAAAAVAVLAVAAAVLVPVALGGDDPPAGELPAAAPHAAGLLAWPARGPLAGEKDLLRSALAAWRAGVPAGQAPTETAVLYAGSPDGGPAVLLQGVDRAGLGWVAGLTGAAPGAPLTLRATEPIGRLAPVLALSTSDADRVRLLAPRDGGILVPQAGDAGDALRRLPLDADGLSEPVRLGPEGVPVVVVRGSGADAVVAGSGRVAAGRLNPVSGEVEVASARLGFGPSADVRPDWYADGALVAGALDGAVTVAAVGPQLTARLGSRRAYARTYEVQHAGDTWISSVVRVGRVACVDSSRLGTVEPGADVPVVVRRCVPAGSTVGVLHVLAGHRVASIRLLLRPGRRGQREARITVDRRTPGVQPAGAGFTVLVPRSALPTGTGLVQAFDAAGREIARVPLRPYRAPRG